MGALEGKVAVVAGATRGIGKGIAVELAAAGAFVYATGRQATPSPDRTGSLVAAREAIDAIGGQGTTVLCDHNDEASVVALFDRVRSDHGKVDIVVNSVFNTPDFNRTIDKKFWEMPIGEMWRDVVDIGTRTAYLTLGYAAPLMVNRGGAPGLVVNVSGRGAEMYRYNVVYGVGKAALDKMTRDMAVEFADHNIAVVSLWPNTTRTEAMEARAAAGDPMFESLAGFETPRYSGRAVVALATDPAAMARSGNHFWTAELAHHYGFLDENGNDHVLPAPENDPYLLGKQGK
ncbi:MAG: SDR family NAD(P)-dependent oxidoreductase [Acidimicrobiia bacterium]